MAWSIEMVCANRHITKTNDQLKNLVRPTYNETPVRTSEAHKKQSIRSINIVCQL